MWLDRLLPNHQTLKYSSNICFHCKKSLILAKNFNTFGDKLASKKNLNYEVLYIFRIILGIGDSTKVAISLSNVKKSMFQFLNQNMAWFTFEKYKNKILAKSYFWHIFW